MNGGDQFFIFLVGTLCGIVSGVLYDFIYCVRYPFRALWVRIATDILFFLLFAGLFLFVSVVFSLPAVRFYMFGGCLAGFFLYLKSFHKIVAFFAEKIYNGMCKKRKAKEEVGCPRKRRAVYRRRRQEGSP